MKPTVPIAVTRVTSWTLRTTCVVSALGLVPLAAAPAAQVPLTKTLALQGAPGDEFGDGVAVHGDIAVVGARIADGAVGAAYIYRRVGGVWAQEARLTPPAGSEPFTLFGHSVAISPAPDGDVVAIGSPLDAGPPGVYSGRVYTYRHDGTSWQLEPPLWPADATDFSFFGATVAVDRNLLVVGAPVDELPTAPFTSTGTIYIYEWDGAAWILDRERSGSNVYRSDQFGTSVGAWDRPGERRVVAGAYNEDHVYGQTSANEGAAYVFREDAQGDWYEEARLTAPAPANRDDFGWSVAISGPWVAVSSPLDDLRVTDGGAVYLYHASDWSQPAQPGLAPVDLATGDRFGLPVALSGDLLACGATYQAGGAGAFYSYRWDGAAWSQYDKTPNPDPAPSDLFGTLSLGGGALLVGALADDDGGTDAGAAYFGALANTPAEAFVVVAPMDEATGTTPVVLTFDQVTSPGATTISSLASGPPPPSGFELGTSGQYYDISTTAAFSGQIEVCVAYDEADFADEGALTLWHYEGLAWVDVTSSLDTVGNVICGEVSSLSPFAVFQSVVPGDPGAGLRDVSDRISALDLALVLGPTASAQLGRRDSLATRCHNAAHAHAVGDAAASLALATTVLARMDGASEPPDWLLSSPLTAALASELAALVALLQGP